MQFTCEHEKSRREKVLDLTLNFSLKCDKNINSIKEICEQFNKKQCINLYRNESIIVDRKIAIKLYDLYDLKIKTNKQKETDEIELDKIAQKSFEVT